MRMTDKLNKKFTYSDRHYEPKRVFNKEIIKINKKSKSF